MSDPGTVEIPGSGGPSVQRFRLLVAEGPAAGTTWDSRGDGCAIGSHEGNDLVIADPTVSRYHLEISIVGRDVRVRDLGSRNGTRVDGVRVVDGFLRAGSLIRLGSTAVRFEPVAQMNPLPLSTHDRFGTLVGRSVSMRGVFAVLERVAATDATVLLEGETGTGKGQAAESLHRASARRAGPMVAIDCSAIPEALLESELFGHERGAFTGADARRVGAFEEASGGTIFLDELGELPPSLQPKLLRVLESREIKRVGSNAVRAVDVRVIAATNRDLRAEVNAGRFRPDLFFRLAVVRVRLPPLREHSEDIAQVAGEILDRLSAGAAEREALLTKEFVERLAEAAWPGNVRELRNYLERCLVYQDAMPLGEDDVIAFASPRAMSEPDISLPLGDARDRVVAEFERRYLTALLAAHGGNVSAAAGAAGVGRIYLHKLIAKYGLRRS